MAFAAKGVVYGKIMNAEKMIRLFSDASFMVRELVLPWNSGLYGASITDARIESWSSGSLKTSERRWRLNVSGRRMSPRRSAEYRLSIV